MALISTRFYAQPEPFSRALGLAYESLVNSDPSFDAKSAWLALSERVSQGIYMGDGLLLPHTRIAGLKEPLMSFAVCPQGFTGIKTCGEEIAQFMCLLLSPLEAATAHTQTIANMAKLLLDAEWKARALQAQSDSDVKALF